MKAISLGFHDIDDSVPGNTSAVVYTVDQRRFGEHLLAIEEQHPLLRTIQGFSRWGTEVPVFITFDDGGSGGHVWGAPALEKHGWHGHFFITTDWIGRPGFMNREQIRELHQRGHIIGSHSCSHPERMSCLDINTLVAEWKDSCALLSDLLGAPVRVASVPGGYYSRKVAVGAAMAGIKVLFTSEPKSRTEVIDGCLVLGRYCIQRSTEPRFSGAIASGKWWPRWQQCVLWNAKKIIKALAGESYITFRRRILSRHLPDHRFARR
jgi:peptidoglycan/xylan/chitin deacetylase (PgdA/CDA1 family)